MKPAVLISKCLGFDACRYNGVTIFNNFVESLKPYVNYITVCPEVEIGLGVPREPIRVVSDKGILRLIQPATARDITENMHDFCTTFLSSLKSIDGCLLKSRSPSCGIKDVKMYPRMEKSASIGKGSGFFGAAVIDHFLHLPIEDEGRITNFRIREHFLTKLFAFARFREMSTTHSIKSLIQFHTENKLLFMVYNQKELKILGQIVANREQQPLQEIIQQYREHFFNTFTTLPRYMSNINVLTHAMGYFKKYLSHREKKFFLDSLEKYRQGKIPLSVNLGIINSWIIRFGEDYLSHQTYFSPYPETLIEITDSGKGKVLQ
jgi:uncharacterized protein YbgA (DUF1722 family)/uncharacterized protein YbbK (DUF523 family)